MSLIRVKPDTEVDALLPLIDEHGYCIIDNLVSVELVETLKAEMAPHIASAPYGNEGTGCKTRRVGALIARSPASHQFIAHPTILGVADRLLRRKATAFQLDITMVNCIEPGEVPQFLHFDELSWDGFPFPLDYPVKLSTVWALDDFTDENGATRLIPGSHKFRRPLDFYTQADTVPAVMAKGSVIVYSGKLVHGGGANRSQAPRSALLSNYCVGWVRQDENQYLSVPIEIARTLPRDLQQLMGYDLGAPGLGYVRNFEHPMVALYPEMATPPIVNELRPEHLTT